MYGEVIFSLDVHLCAGIKPRPGPQPSYSLCVRATTTTNIMGNKVQQYRTLLYLPRASYILGNLWFYIVSQCFLCVLFVLSCWIIKCSTFLTLNIHEYTGQFNIPYRNAEYCTLYIPQNAVHFIPVRNIDEAYIANQNFALALKKLLKIKFCI